MKRLVCLLLLSSCVSTDQVDAKLSGWFNAEGDLLLQTWGPPHREAKTTTGLKILAYESMENGTQCSLAPEDPTDLSKGYHGQSESYSNRCTILFTIDTASNRIESASWRGETGYCYEQIIPIPSH